MKVKINSDKDFDGIFIAEFTTDEGSTYKLYYNLDNWKDVKSSGLYGGKYLQVLGEETMHLEFSKDYVLDTEHARKAYTILCSIGWKPVITGANS